MFALECTEILETVLTVSFGMFNSSGAVHKFPFKDACHKTSQEFTGGKINPQVFLNIY